MPPRAAGQIDELSQSIGRLEGLVEGIDRYVHEREHGINNLSLKVDGLGTQITREVTRMKAELQVQLDAMDRRLTALEADKLRREGAIGLVGWISKNWPFPTFAVLLAGVVAWANGKLG